VEKAKQKGEGGGLVLGKAIVELAKAFKDILQKLGVAVDQLCDIVLQQERRLQRLEEPDFRGEMLRLRRRIEDIPDKAKLVAALPLFVELCHIFGFEDLLEE